MATQWMDDFTSYGTDTNRALRLLDGVYASVSRFDLQADPDPSSAGAMVLRGTGGGLGGEIRKPLSSVQATVGAAARIWPAALPSVAWYGMIPFSFADANANVHIQIAINPSGYIEAYRNDYRDLTNRVLIGTSSTPVMTANAWRHLECKVLIHLTAGTVEVRAEGVTVLNLSGIRTLSAIGGAATSVGMVSAMSPQDGGAPAMYWKDLILWDSTTGNNNNFFGSCQVLKITPNGDTTLNWTPSTGTTGYNLINETTPDDDGSYVSAPFPIPGISQFTLTDLPVNVSTVRAVQIMHRSRKTDGGDGNIQTSAVSGANTGNGADRPITTAYTYFWDIFDLDPSGSAWSRTLVNALQLKLNRTL